jgi:hypothetical protein
MVRRRGGVWAKVGVTDVSGQATNNFDSIKTLQSGRYRPLFIMYYSFILFYSMMACRETPFNNAHNRTGAVSPIFCVSLILYTAR